MLLWALGMYILLESPMKLLKFHIPLIYRTASLYGLKSDVFSLAPCLCVSVLALFLFSCSFCGIVGQTQSLPHIKQPALPLSCPSSFLLISSLVIHSFQVLLRIYTIVILLFELFTYIMVISIGLRTHRY